MRARSAPRPSEAVASQHIEALAAHFEIVQKRARRHVARADFRQRLLDAAMADSPKGLTILAAMSRPSKS